MDRLFFMQNQQYSYSILCVTWKQFPPYYKSYMKILKEKELESKPKAEDEKAVTQIQLVKNKQASK